MGDENAIYFEYISHRLPCHFEIVMEEEESGYRSQWRCAHLLSESSEELTECDKIYSINPACESSTLVFKSFSPARRNACRHALFSFFRPTSSYVASRIKMSPTCMFCVLQVTHKHARMSERCPTPQATQPNPRPITWMNIMTIFDGLGLLASHTPT